MKKLMKDKRNIVIVVISAICLVSIIAGISYAFISYNTMQQGINELAVDCVKVELIDETDAINLVDTYPISNEQGENTKPYRFKITNTCNIGVDYSVNLEVLDIANRIESKNISTSIDSKSAKVLTTNEIQTPTYVGDDYTGVESYKLTTGVLEAGDSKTHSVRIWLNESAGNETQNKSFYSKVVIEAVQNNIVDAYTEEVLNGADPVLAENLIPVIIADDGVVTKANIEEEWYSYEDKVWANAVILEDESVTYNNGDTIPEENIESYFVWIPRYKYKIWDEGQYESLTEVDSSKVHQIEVVFETTEDAESTGSTVNSWLTHPAFTSFNVNGLWVGKFESGYKGATTMKTAQVDSNEPDKLQVKPNVYSWRSIQLANSHLTSYNYKRELDSHMMKNTEWGAVAYLQHSTYGSQASVRINNNNALKTGYAGVVEPTTGYTGTNISCSTTPEACNQYGTSSSITQPYNTAVGHLASTTGNISGVYDMSGGGYELVMGVMMDESNNLVSGRNNLQNSGFKGKYTYAGSNNSDSEILENTDGVKWPMEKYYDVYLYQTSVSSFKNRILGDATGEMGPFASATYGSLIRQIGSWYDDENYSVNYNSPWFIRGGSFCFGSEAGIFFSGSSGGQISSQNSFRVVLAP